jgi:hypothetical protein
MGMQLRVIGTRGGLAEHRHRQPLRIRMQQPATTPHTRRRPEPLEMRQRGTHCGVVRCEQPIVLRQRPQHAQRLGCGERRVEPGDRLRHPTVREGAVGEEPAERCPRTWVTAFQHREQIIAVDLAGETEPDCLVAGPPAGDLAGRVGQVPGVVRRSRLSRRRVDRPHTKHHPPPDPCALVCCRRSGWCMGVADQSQLARRSSWVPTSTRARVWRARAGRVEVTSAESTGSTRITSGSIASR